MKISVHLRDGPNLTNVRSECIGRGFEALGHNVVYKGRGEAGDSDLVVQTGFAPSFALLDAIDKRIPYLIMEASPFRMVDVMEYSSWGYNGLAGGAFRGDPGDAPRWHPDPQRERTEGGVLIIGQKPTDHSLRGSDHVRWIEEKLREYPEATFRHHPLMANGQGSLEDALAQARKVVVYTSTTAVDAALAGCEVVVEGKGCWWDPSVEKVQQLHALSYAHFHHSEYYGPGAHHALESYEEARARAEAGQAERPRGKIDVQRIGKHYYSVLSGADGKRT